MIDRQELLEKMMDKEITRLKKICFKYKRRNFLNNKISINEDKLGSFIAGKYEQVDKKNDFRFNHKITIDSEAINEYVNYKYYPWELGKKFYKNQLIQTIRHELIHAFCAEHYEGWVDIEGTFNDASPIFLAVLYFVDGKSGHNAGLQFKRSKVYKDISNFKTFDELDTYLTKLLLKYEKVTRNLKVIKNENEFIDNKFQFANRKLGLNAFFRNNSEVIISEKKIKSNVSVNSFEIGSLIMPEDIEQLVHKKLQNECFQYFDEDKHYFKNDRLVKHIKTREVFHEK